MGKKIASTISTIILIAIIILGLALALPRLFGVKLFTVLSGSMEPMLSAGDLIYVRPIDPEKIEVGDVISFALDEDTVATHRVFSIDKEAKRFTTKGDANETIDKKTVTFENVQGIHAFTIPLLGYPLNFASNLAGQIISITLIVMLALISILLTDSTPKKQDETVEGDAESVETVEESETDAEADITIETETKGTDGKDE
ncbi:MAG: signal peptidase I [Clostridiales bacterium]|nr:signal peptidase I [Clostridiales bacterium]